MKLLNIALIVLASGLGLSQPAAAQRYPAKPVRLIVPFAPGGSTDIMARLRGQKLSEALGHQFIVDNRGGAGTVIGTEMAARAQPDGYTLLMTNIAFAINPGLHGKKLPYDSLADLTAMGLIASQPTVLAVHPSLPVRSTADLIKLAKQKPGTLSFASAGSGSVGHIAGEMFKIATGVDMCPTRAAAPR